MTDMQEKGGGMRETDREREEGEKEVRQAARKQWAERNARATHKCSCRLPGVFFLVCCIFFFLTVTGSETGFNRDILRTQNLCRPFTSQRKRLAPGFFLEHSES